MDRIPLSLLEAILAFNENKSVDAAAKSLGITQPALSKQLKRLEQIVSEPIFFRSGRRKDLTPFGRSLCARLSENLGNIRDVVAEETNLATSLSRARLRISARRGILQRILTVPFSGSISFEECSHEEILEKVHSLQTEIGITHAVPESYELIAKPLFTEKFHLVVPRKFISVRPTHSNLAFLAKYPCLAYGQNDELLAAFIRRYRLPTLQPCRITEDYGSLFRIVEAGFGWTILPSYYRVKTSWQLELPREILPKREFFLVYRPEYKSVPWFKDVTKEIQDCF